MTIFTLAFWQYALERAVKTVAQAGIAAIGTASLGILDMDWAGIGSVAALAGIVSVLTSVVGYTPGSAVTPAGEPSA